jgi:hypothetical protein
MTKLNDSPPDTAITVPFGHVDEPAIGFTLILWLLESAAAESRLHWPARCQEPLVDISFDTPVA